MPIQAVILAAGKGKRMIPLTETAPKPLQKVAGKNLIEWKLDALPDAVCEVVLVIGYQGEQIRAFFGNEWNGRRIRYAEQRSLNGTAGALLAAKDLLGECFLVMMGDDLYTREDMGRMLRESWAVLVTEVEKKEMGGEMIASADGRFVGIIEPRHFVERGLVNTGMYMLGKEILDLAPVPIGGSSDEYGLPQTLSKLAEHIPIKMLKTIKWTQITTPEDLSKAESVLK